MIQVPVRALFTASAITFFLAYSVQNVGAQDFSDLVNACAGGSPERVPWCQETVLAVQAAQGAVGLAASGGADLPGSASTLGWRTKGSPRFALTLRGAMTRAPIPTLEDRGGIPHGEATATFPSMAVVATVGLFDGFFLGPTAGGFGSIDLTVTGNWVFTPDESRLRENPLGWGFGARVGILRESFSLPGISLSIFRRSLGNIGLGDVSVGDPTEAAFGLEVSSLRGTIGKDVYGIGFFGGAGWDLYGGDVALGFPGSEVGAESSNGELESDRALFFLGASMTFVALQLSAEVGWADGFDPGLLGPGPESFDPSSNSHFGALAIRLTF